MTFTVVTTPRMDAILQHVLGAINTVRVAAGEPPLTDDQLFQQLVQTMVGRYASEYTQARQSGAKAAFAALAPSDRTAIIAKLGGNDPFTV